MALEIYRSDPDAPKDPPLRRWQLLVIDALIFYEYKPGGTTAVDVAEYVRPRVWWFERWGVQSKVYAVLYGMSERGWTERINTGIPVGEHGGIKFVYRVVRRVSRVTGR